MAVAHNGNGSPLPSLPSEAVRLEINTQVPQHDSTPSPALPELPLNPNRGIESYRNHSPFSETTTLPVHFHEDQQHARLQETDERESISALGFGRLPPTATTLEPPSIVHSDPTNIDSTQFYDQSIFTQLEQLDVRYDSSLPLLHTITD